MLLNDSRDSVSHGTTELFRNLRGGVAVSEALNE